MKSLFMVALCLIGMGSFAQEYKVITTIESIVPMGIGRSRIVENTEVMESEAFTTQRSAGKDGEKQRDVKRKDAKIDNFKETKMLNFYSGVGINFQNIASNDALITDKINDLTKDGWELTFVTSGVESKGSKDDNQGIFITRYIFKRN
tara:strand:+ start:29843 stop:30286 length:444 start_codon:yes stop_codon:yes gene_type:complete